MTKISEQCKRQVLNAIYANLPEGPLRRRAKIGAVKIIIDTGIRRLNPRDKLMNIAEFVETRYPQHANYLSMAPACLKKHTVQDCVELYYELRDTIH